MVRISVHVSGFSLLSSTSWMDLRNASYDPAFLRGLFQYGLLQKGQTFGSSSALRGIHSCPHLSQRNPITVMGTRAKPTSYSILSL